MFPDLRNNLKSSGSLLYKCSICYSTLKRSFASRILTTTSGVYLLAVMVPYLTESFLLYDHFAISVVVFRIQGIWMLKCAITIAPKSANAIHLTWLVWKCRIKINSLSPIHAPLCTSPAATTPTKLKAQCKFPSTDCRFHPDYSPRQHCSTV